MELLKVAASQTKLTKEQAIAIFKSKGLKDEQLELVASLVSASEAEEIATASTGGLTAVFKGLWATLKANPLLGVVGVIGMIVSAISMWNQHQENLRQSTLEDANTFKEASSSISDYTDRYKELHQQLLDARGNEEETYNVKQQLLELQKELNDKFGDEYGKINLVTDAYKDQTEAIKNYNTEAAKTFFNSFDNKKEFKKASKKMTSFNANLSSRDLKSNSEKGNAVQEVANSFANKGVKIVDDGDGRFFVKINTDSVEQAYDTISEFEQALRDKAAELGNEHLFDDVLKISGQAFDDAKNTIDKWGDIYQQGLMAKIAENSDLSDGMNNLTQSVQDYNDAVLKSEDPFDDKDVVEKRKALSDLIASMKDENGEWIEQWKEFGPVLQDVIDEADTKLIDFDQRMKDDSSLRNLASKMKGMSREVIESMADDDDNGDVFDKFKEAAKNSGLEVSELIDELVRLGYVQDSLANKVEENAVKTKRDMIDTINSMSDGFDVLDKIYADVYDGGSFDFTNLDTKKFSEAFSGLESEYSDFIDIVSTNPTDINACQQAFNNLTDAFILQKGVLSDVTAETANVTVQMLENMGVANAQEVVNGALEVSEAKVAAQKIINANASYDLATASEEATNKLIAEAGQSEVTAQALFYLMLQQQLTNGNSIDTSASCGNLLLLATNAGVTGDVIKNLTELMQIYGKIETATKNGQYEVVQSLKGRAETLVAAIKKQASEFQSTVRPISNYAGASDTAAAKQKKMKDATSAANKALKEQKEALEKQKKGLENSKDALDEQKDKYDKLYSAITWFYDNEEKKIDKEIDKLNDANDALQELKDNWDGVFSAIDDAFQVQIDNLNAQIDALDKANDKQQKAIELEKAKKALADARNNRNLKIYTKNKGFVYTVDQSAIQDAQDNLQDLEDEAIKDKLQEQIDLLEKYRDLWAEIPDYYEKMKNKLLASDMLGGNWETSVLNPSQADLDKIRDAYAGIQGKMDENDQKIDAFEKQKEQIDKLKELWEDAKNAYENSQNEARLASFFGSDYEHILLSDSASWRQKFADEYGDICAQIEEYEKKIKEVEKQINELDEKSSKSSSGSSGGSGGGGTSTGPSGGTDGKNNPKVQAIKLISDEADNANKHVGELSQALTGIGDKMVSTSDKAVGGVLDVKKVAEEAGLSVQNSFSKAKSVADSAAESSDNLAIHLLNVKASESSAQAESDTSVANIRDNVSNTLSNVEALNTGLSGAASMAPVITQNADDVVEGAGAVVDGARAKVQEIVDAVPGLQAALSQLESSLGNLNNVLINLDEKTFSKVINALGFSGGGNANSLFNAVASIVNVIGSSSSDKSDGSGLLGKLSELNNSDMSAIQNAFAGEGSEDAVSLLSSIQQATNAIFAEGNDECLVSRIEDLTNHIKAIESVTDGFEALRLKIEACKTLTTELSSELESLNGKKINIEIAYKQTGNTPTGVGVGEAIGTSKTFATGTAKSGRTFAKGTGKWALPHNIDDAMISELEPEILLRDGRYHLITSPQLIDLKKGDIIFNGWQTKAILKGGDKSSIKEIDAEAKKKVAGYSPLDGLSFAAGTGAIYDMDKFLSSYAQMESNPKKFYQGFAREAMMSSKPAFHSPSSDNVTNNNNQQTNVNNVYEYHLDNVNLPGVSDFQQFMNQMKNFRVTARQFASKRNI